MNIFKNKGKNKYGFTIIELIVVIAIIAVLAAIVITNVNDISRKDRNVKRLADIKAYAIAFAMAFEKNGEYPKPVIPSCLGNYKNDTCWGGRVSEFESFNTILAEFIPSLPASEDPVMANGLNYNGYVCQYISRLKALTLTWLMEGESQSCGTGKVSSPNYYGATVCIYSF